MDSGAGVQGTPGLTRATGGREQCRVCLSDRRVEFDAALLAKTISHRALAKELGISRTSVQRHRQNHLVAVIVGELVENPDLSPAGEVRRLYARMERHLAAAEASGNLLAIKTISAENRQLLERKRFRSWLARQFAPLKAA